MRRLLVALSVAAIVLLLLPVAADAASGGDALAGLQAVLRAMIEAYIEYLKALA